MLQVGGGLKRGTTVAATDTPMGEQSRFLSLSRRCARVFVFRSINERTNEIVCDVCLFVCGVVCIHSRAFTLCICES